MKFVNFSSPTAKASSGRNDGATSTLKSVSSRIASWNSNESVGLSVVPMKVTFELLINVLAVKPFS